MDIVLLLLLFIASIIVGVCLTLAVQWYLFNVYIMNQPFVGPENKPVREPFVLPKNFQDQVSQGKSAGAINALLQFLFQECRNTKRVRKWLRHRLTLELEELLTRTTTGKLFEKIILRDLQLGSHLPAIHSIEVKALNYDSSTKLLEDVELCLDLDYAGGFQLSIDASMRLSKAAHVSVKVTELKGLARLKFTRVPYTHWSFSFYDDPMLQLTVESQFQGRSLPQINNIIAHQIRKAVKRKHTLPQYKIRYKPFFVKPEPELSEAEPHPGKLEITLFEASRLMEPDAKLVFCKLALDSTAWIEMIHSGTASYLSVDINLSKQEAQVLSPIFKQEFIPDKYQVGIIVENVQPSSGVEFKNGDIVVMINGKEVTSLSVLNKILKSSLNKHVFRVERKIKNILLNDDKLQNCDQPGLRHRRGSGEKTDSDSSNPPSSSDSPAKRSLKGSPEHTINRPSLASEPELDFTRPQMQSSKDAPYSKVVTFNETFKFQVLPEHRYLNMSLWSREEKNRLLGHISIPIAPHCSPEVVGNRIHTFSLLPPSPNMANSWSEKLGGLNGFEPCLCYGDVLVSVCFTASGSIPTPVSAVATVTVTPPPDSAPPTPGSALPSIIATHDFIRTHFTKVTQCNFCFKKIWLKDAFQCQGCLMTCHKKCAPKCQASQPCARTKSQPEIVTTAPDNSSPMHVLHDSTDRFEGEGDIGEEVERDSKGSGESGSKGSPSESGNASSKACVNDTGTFGPKGSIGALLASMAGGIKRTGSVSTLAPPHHSDHGSSSLPPSPNHSPSPSRKASLVEGCLFGPVDCGMVEVDQAVELILSRPHDDNVMDVAKSSGKLLFADLPPELRKTRIDQVMDRLKDAMDLESKNHQALLKDEPSDESVSDLVVKSEERLQALTILMLHCCAGLQDSQENTIQPL